MSQDKLTGGFVNYYLVKVKNPQRSEQPAYQAECEDIIRALGMTFDEGCEFKAIWRTAAARQGNGKPGTKAIYDAEKRVHYAQASLRALQNDVSSIPIGVPIEPGFTTWNPGLDADPPVAGSQQVEIYYKGHHGVVLKSDATHYGSMLRWQHTGAPSDIVAYKVVK